MADEITIVPDYNAYAFPELKLRWWPFKVQYHLSIGLPMLMAHPVDEVEAVIAHEFGHYLGHHPRLAVWTCLLQAQWYTPPGYEVHAGHLREAFFRFKKRYSQFLDSQQLKRGQAWEFDADSAALRLVGRDPLVRMLIRAEIRSKTSDVLSKRNLWFATQHAPHPSPDSFQKEIQTFCEPISFEACRTSIEGSFLHDTREGDTHPSLRDRLVAVWPQVTLDAFMELARTVCDNPVPSAADCLINRNEAQLASHISYVWSLQNYRAWEETHRSLRASLERLDKLCNGNRALSPSECLQCCSLYWALGYTREGEDLLRRALETWPEEPEVAFRWATSFAGTDLDRAIEIVRPKLAVSEGYLLGAMDACYSISNRLMESGRVEEGSEWGVAARSQEKKFHKWFQSAGTHGQIRPSSNHEIVAFLRNELKDNVSKSFVYLAEICAPGSNHWFQILLVHDPMPRLFRRIGARRAIPKVRAESAAIYAQVAQKLIYVFPSEFHVQFTVSSWHHRRWLPELKRMEGCLLASPS